MAENETPNVETATGTAQDPTRGILSIEELAEHHQQSVQEGSEPAKTETAAAQTETPEKKAEGEPAKTTATGEAKTETPPWDAKAAGLEEPYWKCKTPEEAVVLAEKRRRDAEALAHAHDTELGDLRKKTAEKPPDKPAETATAQEWTEAQREDLHRAFDESPEKVLAWHADVVRGPLVAEIGTLKARLEALEGKTEGAAKEAAAEREAREQRDADEEWQEFVQAHPDAAEMVGPRKPLDAAWHAINDNQARTWEPNDAYEDVYGLAKLADSDKDLHAETLKHLRRGYRFAEAKDLAEAKRDRATHQKAEKERQVQEAKRTGRVAAVGTGAGSPGTKPVVETNLDAYLANRGMS